MSKTKFLLSDQNDGYLWAISEVHHYRSVYPCVPLKCFTADDLYRQLKTQYQNQPEEHFIDSFLCDFLICDDRTTPIMIVDTGYASQFNQNISNFYYDIIQKMGIECHPVEVLWDIMDSYDEYMEMIKLSKKAGNLKPPFIDPDTPIPID